MFYKFHYGLFFVFTIAISLTLQHKANTFVVSVFAKVDQPSNGQVFVVPNLQSTVTVSGNTRGGFSIVKEKTDKGPVLFTFQNIIFHAGQRTESFNPYTVNFDTLTDGSGIGIITYDGIATANVGVGSYNTQRLVFLYQGVADANTFAPSEGSAQDIVKWTVAAPEPLTILGSATAAGFGVFFKRKRKLSESSEKDNIKIS
jgi:hypothetical protein